MNLFDWGATQNEHDNRYPPIELTPVLQKHGQKSRMTLALEEVRNQYKAVKRRARRSAQTVLGDTPK